jgi:uncharacterized membrane protein YccC
VARPSPSATTGPGRLVRLLEQAFRFAPVKPAALLGARAVLATALPMLAGLALGASGTVWGILGGYNATLADKGGAYGARARAMAGVTLGGAAAALVGGLLGAWRVPSVPATFAWVALATFAGVYGDAAARAGTSVAVVFAISLAAPGDGVATHALARAGWLLGGGAWAMLLALALWPVRVYRPARTAVAAVYDGLADLARRIAVGGDGWRSAAVALHGPLRTRLETARATLGATRRGRRGESGRGARLLVLVQIADELFGAMVAIEDDVTHGAAPAPLDTLSARLTAVAHQVRSERLLGAPPGDGGLDGLGLAAATCQAAERVAATLHDDSVAVDDAPPDGKVERDVLAPVRANLSLDSIALRHALRVGATAALATALVHALDLQRGYWATLSVITLLQAHPPATLTRSVQRVAGTAAGGLLAALIASVLHDPVAILVVVFLCAAVSVAVLNINYALFSMLLTPTFVLLAEVNTGASGLAGARVLDTLLGAALALASAWLVFPSWERDRFPARLADVLAALGAYVDAIAADAALPARLLARRRVGLALNNAEASFERVLAEPGRAPGEDEAPMTLLVYARRIGGALTALTTTSPAPAAAWAPVRADLGELEAAARSGASLAERAAPALLVPAGVPTELAPRFERLLVQLDVLRRAFVRWRR